MDKFRSRCAKRRRAGPMTCCIARRHCQNRAAHHVTPRTTSLVSFLVLATIAATAARGVLAFTGIHSLNHAHKQHLLSPHTIKSFHSRTSSSSCLQLSTEEEAAVLSDLSFEPPVSSPNIMSMNMDTILLSDPSVRAVVSGSSSFFHLPPRAIDNHHRLVLFYPTVMSTIYHLSSNVQERDVLEVSSLFDLLALRSVISKHSPSPTTRRSTLKASEIKESCVVILVW